MNQPVASLSIFFPAYNEVDNVAATVTGAIASITAIGIHDYEIIVVDDGSTDGTGALSDELATQYVPVRVVHQNNKGYGGALKTGFRAATKDWIVFTDADGQFNLDDLAAFMPLSRQHDAVLGYRIERQDHFGRIINARLWSLLMQTIFGFNVRDIDCAFKLVRRSAIQNIAPLEADGAFISTELIVKLQKSGARIAEVGVHHYPRTNGASTGANWRVVVRAFQEMMRLRRRV